MLLQLVLFAVVFALFTLIFTSNETKSKYLDKEKSRNLIRRVIMGKKFKK